MYKVILLSPEEVMQYWNLLEKPIEEARETGHGESSLFDLYKKFINNHAQVWLVMDEGDIISVTTTEIMNYAQYKSLHIITCTGTNWEEWNHLHSELENFAKHHGCKDIQIWGRKGWERKLKNFKGQQDETYKHTYSVFSMELK